MGTLSCSCGVSDAPCVSDLLTVNNFGKVVKRDLKGFRNVPESVAQNLPLLPTTLALLEILPLRGDHALISPASKSPSGSPVIVFSALLLGTSSKHFMSKYFSQN